MSPIGKEPQFNNIKSIKSEIEESTEIVEVSSLIEMTNNLGLKETEKMSELKKEIVGLIKTEFKKTEPDLLKVEDFIDKYVKYEDFAIEIIDQYKGESRVKAQIALIIL